jgi:hypothetical protein
MSEPAIGWIREVVLDGPDPWVLGMVTLEPPPNGQRLSFQATAKPLAPDTARVHFDIVVADLASAHDRVIEAGRPSLLPGRPLAAQTGRPCSR